jgi:hypothetical protein
LTARLLKRAIVSDLAIFIQEQNGQPETGKDHTNYVVSRLLLFDPMDSPEALGVLASLSGYYLGARAEEVYRCLLLRKGEKIVPSLAHYQRSGNSECARELGQGFESPSAVLEGNALCPNDQRQIKYLAHLITQIDSGKACSDRDLALISRPAGRSAGDKQ